MARELIDGFENGDFGLCASYGAAGAIKTPVPTGMFGGYCADLTGSNGYNAFLKYNLVAAAEKYFAFKVYPTLLGIRILTIYKDATVLMYLKQNSTSGKIEAYVGAGLVATGTAVLSINVNAYLIELRYKIADAGGVIQVKVNGVLDIDYSGDTKPGTDTQMNFLLLGFVSGSTVGCYYIDDLIIDTANWIGDTRIQGIKPDGAGSSTQWTPSTGSNYACVDEIPPDDIDYVAINANDQLDLYSLANPVSAINTVKCVQIQARCNKEGTPTPQNLKLAVRTHSTNYESAAQAVQANFPKSLAARWEVNPNTSTAWTLQELQDMEAGFKSAA
jgi:hypothetical protein